MIDQFLKDCQTNTDSQVCAFGEYFKNNYANKADEWAVCLRGLYAYTTNMVCESLHLKIKHNPALMNGKHNWRIDTLLGILFAVEGDMMRRGITLSCKGIKQQTTINFKAHTDASTKSSNLVTVAEHGWDVKSFTNTGVVYQVTKTTYQCPFEKCSEQCYQCGACWHRFNCTCEAAEAAHNRYFSCKHVHLVSM